MSCRLYFARKLLLLLIFHKRIYKQSLKWGHQFKIGCKNKKTCKSHDPIKIIVHNPTFRQILINENKIFYDRPTRNKWRRNQVRTCFVTVISMPTYQLGSNILRIIEAVKHILLMLSSIFVIFFDLFRDLNTLVCYVQTICINNLWHIILCG